LERLESRLLLTVPVASNYNFSFETTHSLIVDFNIGVRPDQISDGLTNTDQTLQKATTDTNVPASSIILVNPHPGMHGIFSFTAIPGSVRPDGSILVDGNYFASISKEEVADGQDLMLADATLPFFVLGGDANRNRNRTVNSDDFNIMATNFGLSNRTFSQGDFNYDTFVNSDDFNILATNFGVTVSVPAAGAGALNVDPQSDGTLKLSWDASTAGNNLRWRIQKSTNGQDFTIYAHVDANVATFIDDGDGNAGAGGPGLPDGTRIWYRVRAVDGNPESAYTPKRAGNTRLPEPQNVTAQPIDGGTLRIAWNDASQNETEFRIFRSPNGKDSWTPIGSVVSAAPDEFFDLIPSPPTQRFYYVQAHNNVTDSAPSNIAASPPAPPGDAAITLIETPLRLDLDWPDNAEPNVTYNVYRSTDEQFVPDPGTNLIASGLTTSFYSNTTVAADTRYHYYLTAETESGPEQIGARSFPAGRFTQTTNPQGAPTALFAEVIDENNIQLSWQDNSFLETFTVQQETGPGQWQTISPVLGSGRTHFLVENLAADTPYTFRVVADVPFHGLRPSASVVTATPELGDFTELVIAILGHNQSLNFLPPAPPNDNLAGMTSIAFRLRNNPHNLRVIRASEDKDDYPQIDPDGSGPILNWALELIDPPTSGVIDIAVIGYSHGAHVAKRVAQRIAETREPTDLWRVRYTAYVDAIERIPLPLADDVVPAMPLKERPLINPAADHWHDNFFNTRPWGLFSNPLKGVSVPGSARNLPVFETHYTIDDNRAQVQDEIVTRLLQRFAAA
jgi:hypothetical protein